ncbi:MAG: OmpA family protein [Burkholderiales bacterium]|nr:OmpA family protein [Burkholderiales bacterium]
MIARHLQILCVTTALAAMAGCASEAPVSSVPLAPSTPQVMAPMAPKPLPAPVQAPQAPKALAVLEQALADALPGSGIELSHSPNGELMLRAGGDAAFASGSTKLSSKFTSFLQHLADALQTQASLSATVSGHTDNIGSAQRNERLSESRAKAVTDYLASHGIAATRLVAEGKGKTEPIASNDTAQGRTANRRVDIVVTETGH